MQATFMLRMCRTMCSPVQDLGSGGGGGGYWDFLVQ